MVKLLWRTIWQFPKQLKIKIPYDSVIQILEKCIYIYISPHKHLYINAYSIITPNNQKVETIQMSINGWMNNQNFKNTNNGGQAVCFVNQLAFLLNLMEIALLLPIFATTKQRVSPRAWEKRWWSHYRFTKLIFQNCRKFSLLFWIVFLEP